jgi:hypothetical protein
MIEEKINELKNLGQEDSKDVALQHLYNNVKINTKIDLQINI